MLFNLNQKQMTLTEVFTDTSISSIAHLCIDLQKSYIGEEDKGMERLITRTIAPSLLELGVPTYWIYYEVPTRTAFDCGGYKKTPLSRIHDLSSMIGRRDGYFFLPKYEPSALTSEPVQNALRHHNKRLLLVSGLTYPVCVSDTLQDAIEGGLQVVLMTDATDHDIGSSELDAQLKELGVIFSNSDEVIEALKKRKALSDVSHTSPALC
jgi:nicotinamidase-related amidase